VVSLGYMLLAIGLIAGLYGELRVLVVAYNRSAWWFFGCVFVPFVECFFLLLNLKATIKPFGLALLGYALAGLGGWLAGVNWPG